jgi:hypothetical protein
MWKRALIYGGAVALATTALTALMGATGQEGNQALGWVGLLFPVVGIVLAIRAAKKEESGEFTFGEGFKEGAAVSLVAALLGAVLSYLYLTAVNPEYLDAVREATRAQLEAQGLSGRELAQAQQMAGAISSPASVAVIGAVTTFILGLVISALAALFMRRKADPAQYS